MLDIKNITIKYNNSNINATENFSLHLGNGEICCIVGESGSGKTSVLRAIMGILPVNGKIINGDIFYDEKSLLNYSDKEYRQIRGTEISMIFQDSSKTFNPVRKIGPQFVEYICEHSKCNKKEAWDKAIKILEDTHLIDCERIMKSYIHNLSGGMQQRVAIAFAMIFRPKILLADEPTSALDTTTASQIVKQMKELRENFGTSILMVTHNIALAIYMSDYIVVMKNGIIEEIGDTHQILKNPKSDYTKKLLSTTKTLGGRDDF